MNKFEKQLEKWNNGVLRGAQAKLAKTLGVSTATTALWATGKRRPSKGYVAQMASLFSLDTYSVLKLFDKQPSVFYPNPVQSTYMLRERADNQGYTYTSTHNVFEEEDTPPQSNTVQLPFVRTLIPSSPYYLDGEIIEWWSVPRRYAQGAKYLVSSRYIGVEGVNSDDDLCLVKPVSTLVDNACILFTNGKGKYIVRKVLYIGHTIQYSTVPSAKIVSVSNHFYPIGQIVKRINPL